MVVLVFVASQCSRNDEAPAAHSEPAINTAGIEAAIAAIPKRPKWSRIALVKAEPGRFRFHLVYAVAPGSMNEVKADSDAAMMAAIGALKSAGQDPAFVSLYALRPLKDGFETRYGSATYSSANGRIDFKPAE